MINPFRSMFYYFIWLAFFGFLAYSQFLGGPYFIAKIFFWIMLLPIIFGIIFIGKVSSLFFKKDVKWNKKNFSFTQTKNFKKNGSETIIDVDYQEKK